METKTVMVPNVGCDGCVRTIQNEVREIGGVQAVEGNPATKMVTISWNSPATWEVIKLKMAEIDYAPAEA
jgi:copper chaperone CopZ